MWMFCDYDVILNVWIMGFFLYIDCYFLVLSLLSLVEVLLKEF